MIGQAIFFYLHVEDFNTYFEELILLIVKNVLSLEDKLESKA